ncbi:MAG: glycine cleavage system protein T [Flavobacteriales bacterium]|nr:glycine cleavage system protein T [Flavobacteriales bacterium]
MDKKTAFYSLHKQNKAKIVSFAGYMMPIHYKGVTVEHLHVRNSVGVFDVSHMAQIIIQGQFAFDLVQKITTNDVAKLYDGKVQYSCMLNEAGGIIDDLLVYRLSIEKYMLVVNASNALKNIDWITTQNDMNVDVVNITEERGLLAVQGPATYSILQKVTSLNLNSIPYYTFKIGDIDQCHDVIISNTGYTGSGGFELYFNKEYALSIWNSIFQNNEIVQPIGLAARDTLRLEMGYCLYGNDINESRSPIEAGLSWIVSMKKEFIGKSVIKNQLKNGIDECLVGFILKEKGIPRKGYEMISKNGNRIGTVTSGSMSPVFKKGFGMGYILLEESKIGNEFYIVIRDKKIRASIVKRPFYAK